MPPVEKISSNMKIQLPIVELVLWLCLIIQLLFLPIYANIRPHDTPEWRGLTKYNVNVYCLKQNMKKINLKRQILTGQKAVKTEQRLWWSYSTLSWSEMRALVPELAFKDKYFRQTIKASLCNSGGLSKIDWKSSELWFYYFSQNCTWTWLLFSRHKE